MKDEAKYRLERAPGVKQVSAGVKSVQDFFEVRKQNRGKADAIAEKARKDSSLGTRFGRERTDDPTLKTNVADVIGNIGTPAAITAANLRNKDIGKRMTDKQVNDLMANVLAMPTSTPAQLAEKNLRISNIVRNIEMVRRMNATTKTEIAKIANADQVRALDNMERRIEDEDRRAGEKAASKK